jgi:coenzyme F420 hydrogenase subunit beta
MKYDDSWAALQRFRPYGVHLFPDLSGEDADISCADAWNRSGEGGDGYSIMVARTERGRQVLHSAIESGYLVAERVEPSRLLQAQNQLLSAGGAIWGRALTFRLLGLPAPRLNGFGGAAAWWRLPVIDKLKSTLGTLRRIVSRGYYRPVSIDRDRSSS